MNTDPISSARCSLPKAGEAFDVIVAGGGPAGLGAAGAASLCGAKTLLLESRGFLGGTAATALWMPMNRMQTDAAPRGGVHTRFVEAIQSLGSEAYRPGKTNMIDGDGFDFHPDYMRLGALEYLESVGAKYLLYAPVTAVAMRDSQVSGVTVSFKTTVIEFGAKVVIDATGDGDVAFLAGAEMVNGREEDGGHMPISLVFAVGGADTERVGKYSKEDRDALVKAMDEARKEGFLTAAWYGLDVGTIPGVVSVNNGGIYDIGFLDGNSPMDRTLVERLGIRVAADFVTISREKRVPGLEHCYLIRVGAEVSVRDTRRIVGEYVLTVEDARKGTNFDDVVARKFGAIDANQLYIGEMHSGFGYPYRSMIPKRIDGLLAAGRCGSATFLGHAAGKSMGNMMALGQGAGVAAAWCAERDVQPRDADVAEVQKTLREMGVDI